MKPRSFAVLVGLVMVVAGLILGVLGNSVTVKSTNIIDPTLSSAESVDCGSMFTPTRLRGGLGTDSTDVAQKCDDALGSRSLWVWVLIGLGALLALGGAVIKPSRPTGPAAPVETPPTGTTA